MRRSLALLALGALFIAGTVALDRKNRRDHAADLSGISNLRRALDSTRAALAVAPTAADSTRLAEQVKEREYYLGRREFHVPLRQEGLDGFWQKTGSGTILVGTGIVLIILGAVSLRPPRSQSS